MRLNVEKIKEIFKIEWVNMLFLISIKIGFFLKLYLSVVFVKRISNCY